MKKLFVTLVLAIGSMGVVMPTYATPVAQVCDSNSPCLYSGNATSPGDSNNPLYVIVKYGKDGKIVASVKNKFLDDLGTYYVLTSTSANDKQHGTHYFNYRGKKYYFTM